MVGICFSDVVVEAGIFGIGKRWKRLSSVLSAGSRDRCCQRIKIQLFSLILRSVVDWGLMSALSPAELLLSVKRDITTLKVWIPPGRSS